MHFTVELPHFCLRSDRCLEFESLRERIRQNRLGKSLFSCMSLDLSEADRSQQMGAAGKRSVG